MMGQGPLLCGDWTSKHSRAHISVVMDKETPSGLRESHHLSKDVFAMMGRLGGEWKPSGEPGSGCQEGGWGSCPWEGAGEPGLEQGGDCSLIFQESSRSELFDFRWIKKLLGAWFAVQHIYLRDYTYTKDITWLLLQGIISFSGLHRCPHVHT